MSGRVWRLVLLLCSCAAIAAPAFAQVPIEILHSFAPAEPGAVRSLIVASDGNVYGAGGGWYGGGFDDSTTVFRMTPGGALTVVRAIAGVRALSERQGVIYGLGTDGAFRMTLDGSDYQLLAVPLAVIPSSVALVRASDGSLYGTAQTGSYGIVYRLDPQNAYSVVHTFTAAEGSVDYLGPLILGQDGNVYGTTYGSVFRVTAAGDFAIVHTFDCSAEPVCRPRQMVQHPGGDLYATGYPGGLLRITTAGVATAVGPTSLQAVALAAGTDGNLYATDDAGGIYRVTPAGAVTVIRTLSYGEGTYPWDLVAAPDGTIYGSTAEGAPFNKGTVFRVGADGSFSVAHTLINGTEGMNPNALVLGNGVLYGTTSIGGSDDLGTAFSYGFGAFTVLHNFTSGDGGSPNGVQQAFGNGQLYIATRSALLRMTQGGSVTKLFQDPPPSAWFVNAVAVARDGGLYGLRFDWPSIYRYASGALGTVIDLDGDDLWDQTFMPPRRPMIEGPDGSLYGTTSGYNNPSRHLFNPGTLFRIPADRSTALRLKTFWDEPGSPGPIALGADGALYGISPKLEFYRLDLTTRSLTTLSQLPNPDRHGSGSAYAMTGPASDGNFYANLGSRIYRITPAGRITQVYAFPSFWAGVTALTTGGDVVFGTMWDSASAAIFSFSTPEVMSLDIPGSNTTAAQPFYLGGWAIDRAAASGPGVDAVHVWAFPANGGAAVFVGTAEYFRPRGDVAAIYGAQFTNSGFRITVNGLAPGTYTFVAYTHGSETGTFSQWRLASGVTVTNRVSQPAMNIDIPGAGATAHGSMFIAGWAIDRAALEGGGVDAVHVYAFGAGGSATFLGVASYGQARSDVGSAYGAQFANAGFSLTTSASLAPGDYTLVVYARSTVSGLFFSQARALAVRAPGDPLMTIDTPPNGANTGQPLNLAGWAIDRDAVTGPGVDAVHVWAFPTDGSPARFVGTGQLNFARGDVGAIFGAQFTDSGYNVTVSGLPPGQYQIAVYAHSTVTGTFNQSRAVTVTVF